MTGNAHIRRFRHLNWTVFLACHALAFLLVAAPLQATQSDGEAFLDIDKELTVSTGDEFVDIDTKMDYWFLVSYNLMLQDKGLGGILAFDPDGFEYVAGYQMEDTPADFFIDLPKSTLACPIVVPVDFARFVFSSLGDVESISRLAYLDGSDALLLVSVLKVYDNEGIVMEAPVYSLARQMVEGSFAASGLEIPQAYAVYERNGTTQDDLVGMLVSGERTPNEMSLEAIRLMKAEREAAAMGPDILTWLLAAAGVMVVVLLLVIMVALVRLRMSGRRHRRD